MAEYVLEPLGMTRSTFSRKEVEEDDNHASGYSSDPTDNGMTRKPKPHLSGPFQSGAGGLNSSVQELTNYLTMHLNKGKIGDTQIISETILQEMYKPHNQHIRSDDLFLTQSKSVYGFGLSIVDFYGYTLITHGGASGVAGGVVAFIPELNITYAHLYNVGWFSSHMMHIALCYLIGKDPYETLPFLPRREHYKKLSGTYSTYRNLTTITVKMINGLLSFEGGFMSKVIFPLVPVTPEETKPMHFHTYTEFGRQLVAFTELEDGNIIIEIERNIYHKNQYSDDLEPFK